MILLVLFSWPINHLTAISEEITSNVTPYIYEIMRITKGSALDINCNIMSSNKQKLAICHQLVRWLLCTATHMCISRWQWSTRYNVTKNHGNVRWPSWFLKFQLSVCLTVFAQTSNTETPKVPLWGKSTSDRWIPHKRTVTQKSFKLMTS